MQIFRKFMHLTETNRFFLSIYADFQNTKKKGIRQHRFCVRRGDVLLLTILCIIEVRFFVSSVVLKSPPERKAAKRYQSCPHAPSNTKST